MMLVCSRRCGGRLFRALFAEVELDAGGVYQDHRIAQPGYICLNCGSPALDLAEVPAELEAEAQADAVRAAIRQGDAEAARRMLGILAGTASLN